MRWIACLCGLLLLTACSSTDNTTGDKATPGEKASQPAAQSQSSPAAQDASQPTAQDALVNDVAEEEMEERTATAQQRFDKINSDFATAMREYSTAMRKAKSSKERQEIYESSYPNPRDYVAPMLELAKEFPESETAPQALMWIVQRNRGGELADEARQLLLNNHIDSESLAEIALAMMYEKPTAENESVLTQLTEESPHQRVQGIAAYVEAFNLNKGLESLARLDEDEPDLQNYLKDASSKLVALHENGKTDDGHTVESMFENIIDQYGDVVLFERGDSVITVGAKAEGALFEARHLAIGKVVPDIEGEDLDGTEFKLSEYRGKVVMLDFWGDW